MISNVVSRGRALSIPTPRFPLRVLGCVGMALICDLCGLLHAETTAPAPLWPQMAICHAGGVGWASGFGAGLSMGLVMILVSLAPLRWAGVVSVRGGVTALLWVLGAGVMQASILAADRIPPLTGGSVPPAIPRLILLALSVAAALHVPGQASARIKPTPSADGAQCFLRCGPMMIAMMLTGTMSLAWVIAGAVLTQLDEAIGDPGLSRCLTCGIGIAAAVVIV